MDGGNLVLEGKEKKKRGGRIGTRPSWESFILYISFSFWNLNCWNFVAILCTCASWGIVFLSWDQKDQGRWWVGVTKEGERREKKGWKRKPNTKKEHKYGAFKFVTWNCYFWYLSKNVHIYTLFIWSFFLVAPFFCVYPRMFIMGTIFVHQMGWFRNKFYWKF